MHSCCLDIDSDGKYNWLDLFKCARFRLRACGLKSQKKWLTSKQEADFTCRMRCQERDDGIHFVFLYQAYTALVNELQHISLTTHQSIYVDT